MKKKISLLSILVFLTACSNTGYSGNNSSSSNNNSKSTSSTTIEEVSTTQSSTNTESSNNEKPNTTEQYSNDSNNIQNNNTDDGFPDYSYLSEDMLIGSWSPDIDIEQPKVMEFYYNKDGQLCYYCYTLCAKDGVTIMREGNIARMEYEHGHAITMLNQASCSCLTKIAGEYPGNTSYSFYLTELDKGIITDQVYGQTFYKVSDDRLSSGKYKFDDAPEED